MPRSREILLPWDSQPQEAVGIDGSNPVNRGLQFAWDAVSSPIDLVTGGGVSPVNGPTAVANRFGINQNFVATSSQYLDAGTGPNVTFTGDMTLMAAYTLTTAPTTGNSYMLFARDSNTGGRSYSFDILRNDVTPANSGVRFYVNGGAVGVGTDTITQGVQPQAGDSGVALVVWSPSTNTAQLWINGVLAVATTAVTNPPTATTSARIGSRTYAGSQSYMNGQIPFVRAWNRRLYESEIRELFERYWSIHPPRSITIHVVAAGGGTTVTGAVGTAAASGITGGVDANRTIVGSVGTASATGIQGGVSQASNTTVTGSVGTATASGIAGNVNANRTIAGAVGVAQATGITGGVSNTNDRIVSGSVGTATASGISGAVVWSRTVAGVTGEAVAGGLAGGVQSGDAQTGGMGFSMSRMRRLVKIRFNGKLYQAFEDQIPELLETLQEQAEQKVTKKRNAKAKPAPVAVVVSAPKDMLPSLESRIADVNRSIGVLWGVDEDEDEELLWLMV